MKYQVTFHYVDENGYCTDKIKLIRTYEEKLSVLKTAAKRFIRSVSNCYAITIKSCKTNFEHIVV